MIEFDNDEDEIWQRMHEEYGTCSECGQPLCGCCGVCHQCQDENEDEIERDDIQLVP